MIDQNSSKTYVLFHYAFHHLAGTERALANLIETIFRMQGNNQIVLLLVSKQQPPAIEINQFSVKIHYLDCAIAKSDSSFQITKMYFKIYKKAKVFFETMDSPERTVIVSTSALLAATAFLSVQPSMRKLIQFIAWEHFTIKVAGAFSKLIRKLFYRYMIVIVLTKGDRLEIKSLFSPKATVCIPNASPFLIDGSNFSPEHKTILAIGRLAPQKGFDLLINSFSLIAGRHPDWKLKIVGDDFGDKVLLESMIADKHICNIELRPATIEIEKAYQSASFFVLSSRFEGMGMVLIEAMSFGLPVVAFDCPRGPAEIVNENNGFLVENGNIVELAERMESLMTDRNLLVLKSKGALEKATAFSKTKIDKLWQKVL